jgi:methyltransferase (TIGR00027 family)
MDDGLDPLGMSARWVAAARAVESARADRLFDDPWADELAGAAGRAGFSRLNDTSEDNPGLAIRTRYFDDLLLAAVGAGIDQVVLLAAGMDTRSFRLAWSRPVVLFELDRPAVSAHREAVLSGKPVPAGVQRRVVDADLREDWRQALVQAGFSRQRPAAFLVEGLLVYLPDEQSALGVLTQIAEFAASGSVLALDLVGEAFLDACVTLPYRELLRDMGTPWCFGTDNPEGLLTRAGFSEVQVVEPWHVDHGRWRFPTFPRSKLGIARSYFAKAVLTKPSVDSP